jgi:cobalt-zinc-cadmium resistance protein CzcA
MIAHLVEASIRLRWVVLLMTLALVGLGIWVNQRQLVDAYPDISEQMVQVIAVFPGRAPEEVERLVTIPLENAMLGVPRVEVVRSRTIFGLSVVQMVFQEGTESYWARLRVQERLAGVELPEGVEFEMGPLATAYGEIYRYELLTDGRHDTLELRTLNDWTVIRRLMQVPGVAEVSNFGGLEKVFAITFDPLQLRRYNLTLTDIEEAIARNNSAGGGSVVRQGDMALVVRGRGQIETLEDIQKIFVRTVDGTPIYLKDFAEVAVSHTIPAGIFSKDALDDGVAGIVLMRKGENPSIVLAGVQQAVAELNASGLPEGVQVKPYYDRSALIETTLHTVTHSVSLGITLVVLVLIFFLGRPSLAILVALTIPFSLLFALVLMYFVDIPIGLLSIGAIDFGILVDGAVIMTDTLARRFGQARSKGETSVTEIVRGAALDMQRPVFISMALIMVAFLPLLSLTRIEGLLFRPMALTILFALGGALIYSLFVLPALATFFFRKPPGDWVSPLLTWILPLYRWLLIHLLKIRHLAFAISLGLLMIVSTLVFSRLGVEFLPYLDEGVVWVRCNFPDGMALHQTSEYGGRLRQIALEYPDVEFAVVQTGRNDDGTDPFPPSRIEMMIGPRPKQHWTQFKSKQEMVAAIGERFREEFPTTRFNFTQPIIDSVTEDANGTSADLAVELSGDDPVILLELANQTVELLKSIRGARDVNIEQEGPQPQLIIEPDRELCARFNIRIEDVMQLVNTAIGGEPVGQLFEEDRVFNIVARLDADSRRSTRSIGELFVYTEDGIPVPLSQIAKIEVSNGQTIIARQDGKRRLTVRCDIFQRDQGGFVAEARIAFDRKIVLPPGYSVMWLGMFENLERAYKHFMILIPLTIALIFATLLVVFGSLKAALVLMMPVPFAVASGALALLLRDMYLNVSTGVGFATLFGIAMMDAVLMYKSVTGYRLQGLAIDDAIVQGRCDILRRGLMTSLVAILGLLPASLATGLGSDVQRPLANVIVWGLTGSTLFSLFISPVVYRILLPPARKF